MKWQAWPACEGWWIMTECVYTHLCVRRSVRVHASVSKQGTVPLGRHQLCLISYWETFPVTNTESCKTCRRARARAHLRCTLPFMPWFVMKRPCCRNEFNITLGRIQLKLRWSESPTTSLTWTRPQAEENMTSGGPVLVGGIMGNKSSVSCGLWMKISRH